MARLQGWTIAVRIDIKSCDGPQYGVSIQASSAVVDVDVRHDVFTVPETLEEAENLRCLVTACTCDTEIMGELRTLDKSSVLVLDGEEAGCVSFFPKVKTTLVPILSHV